MPRVIFFGSPDFALPSLEALIPTDYCPDLVVTQPDRPAGRGKKSRPTPVRALARQHGLSVEVVDSFKGDRAFDLLGSSPVDFFVVVAFGLIFPEKMLRIPSKEPVNLHASLLPLYRGASPVNMAVRDGREFTGISTMRMVRELDAGPVFLQEVEPIDPMEDAGTLAKRLAIKGGGLLLKTLEGIDSGRLTAIEQPKEGVSTAGLLKKKDGSIPWELGSIEVHNHIRGMNPWPGSHTWYRGEYIKVHKAEPVDVIQRPAGPGSVLSASADGIVVACGAGSVRLTKVQAEGRKAIGVDEFLRGFRIDTGVRFGKEKN